MEESHLIFQLAGLVIKAVQAVLQVQGQNQQQGAQEYHAKDDYENRLVGCSYLEFLSSAHTR